MCGVLVLEEYNAVINTFIFIRHGGALMSRSELTRNAGAIAALIVSYAAAFWMLTVGPHNLSLPSRLGWICALLCPLGVGVFFWSRILAAVAKRRQWTQRNCQYMALLTMIPGSVLFFAAGANL